MFLPEKIKRIVVKVGTSTLTYDNGKLNLQRIDRLVRNLCDMKNSGRDVILVSSGAIGVGVGKLNLQEKPTDTPTKQAVAAVGQVELMHFYDKLFSEYGQKVAQVLLTKDVFEHDDRRQNVINAFQQLFTLSAIPIVNENDTVATDEIEFGDNDTLSALVAVVCKADLLILLTDIDGLYDGNPKEMEDARIIPVVHEITEETYKMASGAGSNRGTGGMVTKLDAAKIAMDAGIDMMITSGEHPDALLEILAGRPRGTLFCK